VSSFSSLFAKSALVFVVFKVERAQRTTRDGLASELILQTMAYLVVRGTTGALEFGVYARVRDGGGGG